MGVDFLDREEGVAAFHHELEVLAVLRVISDCVVERFGVLERLSGDGCVEFESNVPTQFVEFHGQ